VTEDRLDHAATHFETVLGIDPEDEKAQEQLNLINLYTAALLHWEGDWAATIQALKGLYAHASDYRDVKVRLRDAYIYRAQAYVEDGDWCSAADDYAAAVELMPLETTVDRRDDARIQCQTAAEAPTPAPTMQIAAKPTSQPASPSNPAATRSAPEPTASEGEGEEPEAATPTPQAAAVGNGRIAFTSFDAVRQRYDIYVVDLSQDAAKLLRENASQPAFALGGQRLAFRNLDPGYLGLGLLDAATNGLHELTAHGEDSTPAWSPDGQQIVFASNKHGDRRWRIYVISPGAVRGEGEEWSYGQMPAWSSDGSRVAYHGCDDRGDRCGVWAMKAGGFEPSPLTTDPSDTAPAWSPGASQVAFVSTRGGNWDLYVVEVASGQTTRLTDHAATDVAPTWSPDGQRLAFLSNREGAWAVYVLELKSGQVQKVIATGDAYPDPVGECLSWVP
jgi:hypothetical protein